MNCTYILLSLQIKDPKEKKQLFDIKENKLVQSRVAEERGWDHNKTRKQNSISLYEKDFLLTSIWILINQIIVFTGLISIEYIVFFIPFLCSN